MPLPTPALARSDSTVAAAAGSTPEAIWEAVLARIADRPSMSWIKHLELRQLDGSQAHLHAVSGGRELVQFVAGPRRQQLADLLQQIIGRPVRIEIDSAGRPEGGEREGNAKPAAAPGSKPRESSKGSVAATSDWQKALANPLVKQVMEVFDASVVSIGPEATPASVEASTAPAAATDRPVPELFPTQTPARRDPALTGAGIEDMSDIQPGAEELDSPEDQDNV